MSLSHPGRNNVTGILDNQQKTLRSYLSVLIHNNNVCNILASREIGGSKSAIINNGINFKSRHNLKKRRFIITGKNCFTQMWKVTDIVYTLLRDKGYLYDSIHSDNSLKENKRIETANKLLMQSNRQPTTKFIKRHCSLLNIKDQIHIIEHNQKLDNLDIERINKCFLLIIIDYGNDYSDDIRGNREYYGRNHRILERIIREDNLNPVYVGMRNSSENIGNFDVLGNSNNLVGLCNHDERVMPELLTVYNSELENQVSVLHKNICYVSTKKVLYHNSWINITELSE